MNFEITEHIQQSIKNLKEDFKNDYTFFPVATEKEVENFENRFSIRIPEDFRWFLLNIANGVESCNPIQDDLFKEIDFSNYYFEKDMYNPSLPFKLTKPFDYHHNKFEDFSNGTIDLAGYGCGCYSFLVINGEEYANIWTDNFASNSEVYPEKTVNKRRIQFHEWLDFEVQQKIAQKKNFEKEIQNSIQKEKSDVNIRYESIKSDFQHEPQKDDTLSFFKMIKRMFQYSNK